MYLISLKLLIFVNKIMPLCLSIYLKTLITNKIYMFWMHKLSFIFYCCFNHKSMLSNNKILCKNAPLKPEQICQPCLKLERALLRKGKTAY